MAKLSPTTQNFIPIKNIRDGVVLLKDGGLRIVLMVSSVNFALKSQDEQMALLLQFQNMLNSLDFSIQIMIQSRKLDIAPYIDLLRERVDAAENDLIRIQVREYMQFIQNLTASINIMSKTFFVVIPYSASVSPAEGASIITSFFSPKQEGAALPDDRFEEYKLQLEQRAMVVEQSLASVGLRSVRLGSEELIELFYKSFNPDEQKRPPVAGGAQ
jgi:type IV secretory pathway VirB4 component